MGDDRLVDLESELLSDKEAGGKVGIDFCESFNLEGGGILFQPSFSSPHRAFRRASNMAL